MQNFNYTDNDDHGMVIISTVDLLMDMSSASDLDGNFDDQIYLTSASSDHLYILP